MENLVFTQVLFFKDSEVWMNLATQEPMLLLYTRDENLSGPARPRPNGPAQPGPGRAGPGRRGKSGVRPTGPKIFLEVNFLTLINICLLFTVKNVQNLFFEKHKARMTSWDINIRYYTSFQLHPRVW